jgi:Carboxypeptidase regulatory-like domain
VVSRNLRIALRVACLLGCPLLAVTTYAQFSGNIQGVVEDPSGAVVSKAKVTLVNTATQVTLETTSNVNGEYRFVSLLPEPTSSPRPLLDLPPLKSTPRLKQPRRLVYQSL